MILSHNKKHSYKYLSAKSGILTLESCAVKVSRATEFNDPFDTFHELVFDFNNEDVTELYINKFKELIKNRIPIDLLQQNMLGQMVNTLIQYAELEKPEVEKIREMFADKLNTVNDILRTGNEVWKRFLYENRIFCMTETYDNLLMWAHYADSHKGIVLRFNVIPELQSAICAASPIVYSEYPPTLGTFDEMFYRSIKAIDNNIAELNEKFTFTKSSIWSYEKEWRYVVKQRDETKGFDINNIDPREINGVYFGCKIENADKDKICELAKRYPDVELYQGIRNDRKYKVEFEHLK